MGMYGNCIVESRQNGTAGRTASSTDVLTHIKSPPFFKSSPCVRAVQRYRNTSQG